MLVGDHVLERLQRARLDEDDAVDRSLEREREFPSRRLVVGAQDLDPTERDDPHDGRRGQPAPGQPPARQPDPDQQDGHELGAEVAAGEREIEGEEADDGRVGGQAPRAGPSRCRQDEAQGQGRKRDTQLLDREPGQLAPGSRDVVGQGRQAHAQDGRQDQGQAQRGHAHGDGGPPRAAIEFGVGRVGRRRA